MLSDLLLHRAKALKLHGLINHWDEVVDAAWLEQLISWEETYRSQKILDSRLRSARIGRFKPTGAGQSVVTGMSSKNGCS